jgi:tRNA dimethylallyltransferase
MSAKPNILCIIGPTASGKSSRAVTEAKLRDGEVISVDSRQVYRGLDIGTEKTLPKEMEGIPHHLIDIREPEETYSAGDFVEDANRIIYDMVSRGKTPILAGGTHFYFDALLYGLPSSGKINTVPYTLGSDVSTEELFAEILKRDPRRAKELDPKNRRRLIRALELIETYGSVPERARKESAYNVEWIIVDPGKEELEARLEARLTDALARGLVEEVRRARQRVGDTRLNELGLEYRVVGEYVRGELSEEKLLPTLLSKLKQYARRQRAWIRKLTEEQKTSRVEIL